VKLLLVGALTLLAPAVETRHASLRIVAPDGMEFRTLGLSPGAFAGSRTFHNLAPGRYVVVQAPPVGVYTQVGPGQWTVESGLTITCSDGVSGNQYDLAAGDNVVCTYTLNP
jgi:hypothetical protein